MPARHRAYTLFAADPGERTGVVLVEVAAEFIPGRTCTPAMFRIADQDVFTVSDCFTRLAAWIGRAKMVAYETWRLYPDYALQMVGNEMVPSQVVGMIRYLANQKRKTIVSNGAECKRPAVATMPAWLRDHMAKSSEQHDQDAIMHAWFAASERYYAEAKGA